MHELGMNLSRNESEIQPYFSNFVKIVTHGMLEKC